MRYSILIAALVLGQLTAAERLHFEHRHIEKKLPGCGDAKDGCVHAELDYVQAVSGPDIVRTRINLAIRAELLGGLTPEGYVKAFIDNYREERTSFPEERKNLPEHRWSHWKQIKVLRATPPVLSLSCSEWSYEGGAHPTSQTRYVNLDANTGDHVTLTSILKDESLPRLTVVAESHFRKQRKLRPTADLKEAGFNFPDHRFRLNDTYGIGEKELIFFFNDYEIGPHAMGTTEVPIPYAEIRDLLRPEFLK